MFVQLQRILLNLKGQQSKNSTLPIEEILKIKYMGYIGQNILRIPPQYLIELKIIPGMSLGARRVAW